MPLVAWSDLPSFQQLREEGQVVLTPDRAVHQDFRELHVGLLNMMPDAALTATERQFFRLVGSAVPVAQFYMHPFSLPGLPRSEKGKAYVDRYYEKFEDLKNQGLDALIITGANVTHSNLEDEPFWGPLVEVISWAQENVTSVLCSCLATHAMLQLRHGIERRHQGFKRWGVFEHYVTDRTHPLVNGVNTRFDVPHSRFNDISREVMEAAGLKVLVESETAGVHLAVSEDLIRTVYFQGHAEYDLVSLLKEYKREVKRYAAGEIDVYPPMPDNYFRPFAAAVAEEYRDHVEQVKLSGGELRAFPEALVLEELDNTWHDTGAAVVGNWVGLIYLLTNNARNIPYMDGIDPNDPLGLIKARF